MPDLNVEIDACMLECVALMFDMIEREHRRGHTARRANDGECLAEAGGDVPVPLAMARHRANPDFADGICAAVDVDVARFEGKAEKINITLPRRLLAKIDDHARAHGARRSVFLSEAARRATR